MSREIVIDARTMEAPEPLLRVMDALETLEAGDTIRLIAPHEPKPLYRLLARHGYEHHTTLTERGVEVLISMPTAA